MNFIENFKINQDVWRTAFTSGSGDDVNMEIDDIFLYTLLPFGQLFMRIFKYNGSLDKIYLLLLLIPSFWFIVNLLNINHPSYYKQLLISYLITCVSNAIPAIIGYYKKINKVDDDQGQVLDISIFIPIILRFLLGFGMIYINYNPVIMHIILFSIVMITVYINLKLRHQCNIYNSNETGNRFKKVLLDSVFIYSIIFIITGSILRLKQIKKFAELFSKPIQYYGTRGHIILMIGWIGGALLGYILNNMININFNTKFEPPYNEDDVCKGVVSPFKIVFTIILLIVSLVYYIMSGRLNYINEPSIPFQIIPPPPYTIQ